MLSISLMPTVPICGATEDEILLRNEELAMEIDKLERMYAGEMDLEDPMN